MRIDTMIKAVFEREVEENRSKTAPFPNYRIGDLGEKAIIKNRLGRLVEIGLAACFIIVFSISVFLKDGVYRRPSANQGVSVTIVQLFPENPIKAFYDFIWAIHSSF